MKKVKVNNITKSALMAALIFIATYIHIPMPTLTGGYVHIGDALIFIAATLMPAGYACCAAAIGAGLSDVLSGFLFYAPATILIKCLTVLCFVWKKDNPFCWRNLISIISALVINVVGYYLAEMIIYGSEALPMLSVPGNITQTVVSLVVFLIVRNIKSRKI